MVDSLIQDLLCALGSMPPNSHSIFDEGAVFMSFKLVDNGIFQEGGKICYPYIKTLGKSCPLLFWPCFVEVIR